jgi:integrase
MLTTEIIESSSPQSKAYKLYDTGNMYLNIATTGFKSWRWRYRFGGTEKLMTLGNFPDMSLEQARTSRDSARNRLQQGRNPAVSEPKLDTFESLARAWYRYQESQWSSAHAGDVLSSLEREAFPVLGGRKATDISPPDLLAILRNIEKRGHIESARRLKQRFTMIFSYGEAEGIVTTNPAIRLTAAMRKAPPCTPQAALTDIEDCRGLLSTCEDIEGRESAKLASRFLALTAVRWNAVRGMRWGEIEDLDGENPLWRIPSIRMKLSQAKKGNSRYDHLVPLSHEAVIVIREAAMLNGFDRIYGPIDPNRLVFSGRTFRHMLGMNSLRDLYIKTKYNSRHVPHGWRASFSTILNETLDETWRTTIDRALAHTPKDKVEAAYNRSENLKRRREVFEVWGRMLYPENK